MNIATNDDCFRSMLQGQSQLPVSPLMWLNKLRASAVDRVSALKIPTTRDEEWRFTDIAPLTKFLFQPADVVPYPQTANVSRFYLTEASIRLVFIDGVYTSQLSSNLSDLTKNSGAIVSNLSTGIPEYAAMIKPHLGGYVEFGDNIFSALNTAFLHDGALVIVPRDAQVKMPVHLLFITTQAKVVSYPRCLIVTEPNSAVTIFEDYVALQQGTYVNNAVTEITLANNASLNHIRVQRDSHQAFHIGSCAVSLARSSRYQSVNVALGARISRYNLNVLLADTSAEATVDGLTLIAERQLADIHTCIDHAKSNGTSRQLHKCIVGGNARAVFSGKIMVRPDAQHTNSFQSSRNLLLTPKARVDTKPQLEIFADDVKCVHGATVGQLNNEEVFYLKSRGLSDTMARNLLTYAFGAEIIDRIPIASLRCQLEQIVLKQTQEG